MKKNREAKKAKKELEFSGSAVNGQVTSTSSTSTSVKMELTDDPEKNKKIKKVRSVSKRLLMISFSYKTRNNVVFLCCRN